MVFDILIYPIMFSLKPELTQILDMKSLHLMLFRVDIHKLKLKHKKSLINIGMEIPIKKQNRKDQRWKSYQRNIDSYVQNV